MEKYNYYTEVTNDIVQWINDNNFDLSQFEDRYEAIEFLRDELWAEDEITGNGSWGYASESKCEEFLCHNINILIEAFDLFGVSIPDLREQYKNNYLARYLDCFIRLYVLDSAIESVLETLEGYGFKYRENNE